jgi:drug/metabolite transporter (DMT)-like permease
MSERMRKIALTEGITAGILFGTAAILIRFLDVLDAFSIAFWRLIIASIVLSLLLFGARRPLRSTFERKNLKDLAILGLFLGLHFVFFISAVKDTTILNATVLVNTTPVFSVLISTFLFNVKPSRLGVIGLTISFLGVCLITYADASPAGFSLNLKGDLEAVLAAVVEAFYLNLGRKTRSQLPVFQTMLSIYLFAALIIGGLSIPFFNGISIPKTMETIIFLIGLGLLPTAIAHTLYFSSLSSLKSFETATMALLEPIGATILGLIVFNEVPVSLFILGALLVIIGILVETNSITHST